MLNQANGALQEVAGIKEALAPMPEFALDPQPASGNAEFCSEIEQMTIAWMLAAGIQAEDIEESLQKPPGFVTTLRSKPKFRTILKRCLEMKAKSLTEQATDPEELFNSQIMDSAAALMQVRDDPFEKGSSRVKAAKEFLDRAPKAPKVRKEVEDIKTVIMLPVGALKGMQQALLEEGSPQDLETIQLLEGSDYTVEAGAEVSEIEGTDGVGYESID